MLSAGIAIVGVLTYSVLPVTPLPTVDIDGLLQKAYGTDGDGLAVETLIS